jgi:hypothetical protein
MGLRRGISRRPGLTPWAVVSGAAGKFDGLYFRATSGASCTLFAARNEEGLRKPINESLSAGAGINRGPQHLLDTAEQALLRFGGEPVGARSRMAANGSGLQLSTIRNIVMAWILTLPAAMMLSAGLCTLFVNLF